MITPTKKKMEKEISELKEGLATLRQKVTEDRADFGARLTFMEKKVEFIEKRGCLARRTKHRN